LLYPNYEEGYKKLGTTMELMQWKAKNGVFNKGFEKLLKIIKKMLPKDGELPATTHDAKQAVCCRTRFSKEDQALIICMPRKSTHTTTE
jgi:hypothetical protein